MSLSGGVATLDRRTQEMHMPVVEKYTADRSAEKPKDLAGALKRREPVAFEQLLDRHGAMLYRVGLRLMGRREDAEEVVQETLLTVYEKIETFDGRAALTTWLYRIVTNRALMRLRSRSRASEVPIEPTRPALTGAGERARDLAKRELSAEDALLRKEALDVLRREIEQLPVPYRAVYVLAEIEELAHQEIANLLDLTVPAVKTRLHRARLFLREALADYFGNVRRGAAVVAA